MRATGSRGRSMHRGSNLSWCAVGEGPPVVMIQGVGVGGGAWQPQIEALSRGYRCLAFDNRGFGASLPMGGELSAALMADDLLHLMDVQGWRRRTWRRPRRLGTVDSPGTNRTSGGRTPAIRQADSAGIADTSPYRPESRRSSAKLLRRR